MKTREHLPANLNEQIQNFYDPAADQRIVKRLWEQGVPAELIPVYIQENNLKFVMEFAAGVKKTSIEYQIREDRRIYSGPFKQPVEHLFYQTAQLAGLDSREEAELTGWRKLEQQFKQSATDVIQVSPPSQTNPQHGEYGFVFWFQRQGDRLTNHILRYSESDRINLLNSRRILESFNYTSDIENITDQTLLENPINISHLKEQIPEMLKQAGLTLNEEGTQLEAAILKDPEAQILLNKYYRSLSDNESVDQSIAYLSRLFQIAQRKATVYGQYDRPVVTGAGYRLKGSCPITKRSYSNYEYANYLWESVFECPNCGYISFRPVGNQCPSCKMTKEKWKEQSESEICD